MAVLFEHFKSVDIPAERKKAREEGWAEGHAEGRAEGRAEGHAEGHAEGRAEGHAEGRAEGRKVGFTEGCTKGEARFARLTQVLLKAARTDDLARAVTDTVYREILYRRFELD